MSQPNRPLANKLALTTGGSGGIGKATALALAREGCSIALHYHKADEETIVALADEIESQDVVCTIFKADLSSYEETRELHESVVHSIGHPDILYNNAGSTLGQSNIKDISEVSIEDFENTWRLNCGSAYLLTQLCLPHMQEIGWGRVIFCSSVAALTGGVVGPHYASSKSALHGLIHWLSQTNSKNGITVNGIAPALIAETAMLPGSNEVLAAKIPVGRLGRPEEIADTVVWMVKNAYVTNKIIAVDGGMYAQ